MPTLKQLTCTIEWAGSQVALKEYSTAYSDGFVQTYVAIPPVSTTFNVHLKSNGYIAPGLAMFVYMDGKYQCNRNRRNLKVPDGTMSRRHTEIDFRVRQKEEKLEDGSYLGKEWRFEKLNIVAGNAQALQDLTSHNFDHLGTIEVVVLRCHADPVVEAPKVPVPAPPAVPKPIAASKQSLKSKKPAKTPQPTEPVNPQVEEVGSSSALYQDMMGGLFDGAGDERESRVMSVLFGGDGAWDEPRSRQASGNQWGYTMTDGNQGVYHGANQQPVSVPASHSPHRSRSRGRAHHRFKGDWTAEQDNLAHAQRGPSRQRVSSFHSAGGKPWPGGMAWPTSPVSSVRNADHHKDWNAPQVSVPPGGPAVIINVNQPAPSVGGWGPVPENLTRPGSPVDSRAAKQSVHTHGAQRQESWPGKDHAAREDYAPQPLQFTPAPSNSGVELVDGKWRPKKPKGFGWTIGGDHDDSESNHQRKASHATVVISQHMPGDWGPGNNRASNPQWEANNTSNQPQNTNWGGGGIGNVNDNNGRYYGSDSSSNGNVGGWGAEKRNQNATAGGNNGPAPGNWNGGNSNGPVPGNWNGGDNNGPTSGNWNQSGNNNGSWNNHQAPTAGWRAYPNTPIPNSPLPGIPINNNTVMPEAWGQPANSVTQGPPPQPPPPPSQPVPPVFTQSQDAAPAPSQQGPPPAHARVHSMALSTQPQVKSYWAAWNKPPSPPPAKAPNTSRRRSEVPTKAYVVDEEPLYSVPEEIIAKKKTSHQVQPGPGAMYTHKVHSPRYMDSMEEPYAVFVFKYRSKEVLEQLLNFTISEDPEDEKKRLMSLSKDEVIEELLAAKLAAPITTTAPSPAAAPAPEPNLSWGAAPANSPPSQSNASATNGWQNNAAKPAAPPSNQWQNSTNDITKPPVSAKHDPFMDTLTQKLGKVAASDSWGGAQQNTAGPEWGEQQGGAGNWGHTGGGGGGSNRGGASQQGNGANWGGQNGGFNGGGGGPSRQGGGSNWGGQQSNGGKWGGHSGGGGGQPSNGGNWGQGGVQGSAGNWGAGGGHGSGGNWGSGGGGAGADAPPAVVW